MTATVLVVDDDRGARLTVEAQLRPDGYRTIVVASGTEALAALAAEPVDLVVADVMMPGIDGLALCRAIKAHPEWQFVPVILVTALDGHDDEIRGMDAGADQFVTKPVDGRVLRARVRMLLRVRARFVALRSGPGADRRATRIADARLTGREHQVLELVLQGSSHADIAATLGISERTSKFHQANLFAKLGVESRLDLLRIFA